MATTTSISTTGSGDLTVPTAAVEVLYDGCRWAEGPVWFDDGGYLVWSDIPNNRMLRWTPDQGVGVFRADCNFANGNTRDRRAGWSPANMAAGA